jgi:hypothetical protein
MAVASVAAPRAARAQNPSPPAPPAGTAPAATEPSEAVGRQSLGTTVPELGASLSDPRTSPPDRLEAARRLVARQSPDARDALRQVVTSPANAAPRIAVLRALADDPNPDPGLLPNLLAMVQNETDERVVAPAAVALGAYKNNAAQVIDALSKVATATARPQPLRSAAIRGLGLLIDQAATSTLVRITTNPNEAAQVVSDAADALVELTGIESNGRDPIKWAAWQTQNGNLPAPQWKALIADSRAARDQQLRRRLDDLVDELQPMFEEQYRSTPPEKMAERLQQFLNGAAPDVRRIGARIAYKAVNNVFGPLGRPKAEAQERLEDLVGDADAGVRLDALLALESFKVGDRALAAIRQQLSIEPDSRVKAAMARTLSKLPGLDYFPDLNRLLDDPSPVVVREAADAIRRRAPVIVPDAALQQATAQKLQGTIKRLPNQPAFAEARRTSAEALAALKEPTTMGFAQGLLSAQEPDLRAAGLTIMGELGKEMAGPIIRAVDRETSQDAASVRVRKSGMDALARTRNFNFSAEWLFNKFNPRGGNEPSAEVRSAAQRAYLTLLKDGDTNKLLSEASRVRDDATRIEIFKVLVGKFKDAGQREDAAIQQISLGKEYMNRGQPKEAADVRQDALNCYLERRDGPYVLEPLAGALTESLLQSRQYDKLAAMASNLFRRVTEQGGPKAQDPYQGAIGPKIRNEAQRLQESTGPNRQEDWANAARLIEAASRMDPPLAKSYLEDLPRISARLQEQQRAATRPGRR